jgi:hypothetical protein
VYVAAVLAVLLKGAYSIPHILKGRPSSFVAIRDKCYDCWGYDTYDALEEQRNRAYLGRITLIWR